MLALPTFAISLSELHQRLNECCGLRGYCVSDSVTLMRLTCLSQDQTGAAGLTLRSWPRLFHPNSPRANGQVPCSTESPRTKCSFSDTAHQKIRFVSPTGPLARPRVPKGPIFVLDFDSSWRSSDTPHFTADRIVEVADCLHRPLRSLFDRLITPQLLAIFRQEPQND